MAKFILEINCDTPAFRGNADVEVRRILDTLFIEGVMFERPYPVALRDINGNVVGYAEYTEGE